MPIIKKEIYIQAPIEMCFDLARNVEVHTETTAGTKEKAVAGVTKGLLEKGDRVTWEAIHFGMQQRLTAEITDMHRPYEFVDVLVSGAFHSFTHTHQFEDTKSGTLMRDIFEYRSPFGVIGKIADKLFLERYMTNFLIERAKELKRIAESKSMCER